MQKSTSKTPTSSSLTRSYLKTKELYHLNLRVSKKDSVYLYFILESHEGICFYSTIHKSISDALFREIEIYATIEFKDAIDHLITNIQNEINLEIILCEVVIDNKDIVLC
ncbi:MAG: hypothetical protein HQK51_15190 [Oligoflexia bacterium]|nr:hypothetical protein [Oligoflexia bacterium]